MNRKIKVMIYILIIIIALVEIIIFLNIRNLQEQNNQIIEVSEDDFEKEVLHSKNKVLVYFYAAWCNSCKTLEPIIEEFVKEYNIKVTKIDVDNCKELVSKYNIKAIPTLIVMEKGNEINRSLGADSKNKILQICGIK